MPKYFKVVDSQATIKQNYFSLVFFRDDRVKNRISRLRWAWLCLVEVIFGQELLESLVTTASNSGCPEDPDSKREYGEPNQLNLHIPSGLFTNLFRTQILQLLYYKYYLQYLFILPVVEPVENEQTNTIDVTRVRFRLRKKLLYLVIPFRRVYLISAVSFNLIADVFAYLATTNVYITLAVAATIEGIRRVLKF